MTSLPCCLIFSSTDRTMVATLYGTTAVLAYVLSAARLAHGRCHAAPPSHGGGAKGAVAAAHLLLAAGASADALAFLGLSADDLLPRATAAAERGRALLVLLKPPAWRSSPHGRWQSMRSWMDGGQAEPRQELAARTVVVPCTAGREERAVALPRTAGRSSRAAAGRDLIQGAAELAAHAPWQWSARLPHGREARRQDGLQAWEGRRRGGPAPGRSRADAWFALT